MTYTIFDFYRAARSNDIGIVRKIATESPIFINEKIRDSGFNALMYASAKGNIETVILLTKEFHALVDLKDSNGWSALMHAVDYGSVSVVKFLIEECHANFNLQNRSGETVLMMARYKVREYLLGVEGIDANLKCYIGGFTALHLAASNREIEVAHDLVKKCGADVNITDNRGYTALMICVEKHSPSDFIDYFDIMRCLVKECNANVEAVSDCGDTALMIAAQKGDVDLIKFLVKELGANVHAERNDRMTSLMLAIKYGHGDAAYFLTEECGAIINADDKKLLLRCYGRVNNLLMLITYCDAECSVEELDLSVNTTCPSQMAYIHHKRHEYQIITAAINRTEQQHALTSAVERSSIPSWTALILTRKNTAVDRSVT